MHDLPEYAHFSPEDRTLYQQFNLAFAVNLLYRHEPCSSPRYFVQDYQLALVPSILCTRFPRATSIFWHIPWPKSCTDEFVPLISEIANGILSATRVGFHINEYARNFLRFVETFLSEYCVDHERQLVSAIRGPWSGTTTQIIVQPLGLDMDFWKRQSNRTSFECEDRVARANVSGQYVLSVDRVDYTKGVFQRLQAINDFFEMCPERRREITFLQVCHRTRRGLAAFDRYWNECVALAREVNLRWEDGCWKPVVWISEPLSPPELAELYRCATIMLVNPLRDGLNLTAKEFVACAGDTAGALLLSDTAGVWRELGRHSLRVIPAQPRQMASSILAGLSIPLDERRRHLTEMQKALKTNRLSYWWHKFGGTTPQPTIPRTAVEDFRLPVKQQNSINDFSSIRT